MESRTGISSRPPAGRKRLHHDEHFEVTLGAGYVLIVRSEAMFDTLEDVVRVHRALGRVLDGVPRESLGVLYDLRLARGRNDPGFEAALAPHRKATWTGWKRTAVVVKSVTGGLQVRRHMVDDGVSGEVYDDLERGIEYVRG